MHLLYLEAIITRAILGLRRKPANEFKTVLSLPICLGDVGIVVKQ